jgi:hypothetical protein
MKKNKKKLMMMMVMMKKKKFFAFMFLKWYGYFPSKCPVYEKNKTHNDSPPPLFISDSAFCFAVYRRSKQY